MLQYPEHARIYYVGKGKRKGPLTWNGGSLYMAASPHPCLFLAQSQVPHLRPPPPPALSPIALLPANTAFINKQTTLTHPILPLSGTLRKEYSGLDYAFLKFC